MPTVEIKTHQYRVKDICMNVAEAGEGDALVFIHGWTNSWIGWTLLANELAASYKLYMIDLPGFGDSDRLPAYSLDILGDYVAEFIAHHVTNLKAIVGASSGTFFAVYLARDYAYDVPLILIDAFIGRNDLNWAKKLYARSLILTDRSAAALKVTEWIIRQPLTAYFIEKFIHAYHFDRRVVDAYNIPGRKKVSGKAYVQLGPALMSNFVDDALPTIRQQTILIFGEHDRYVPSKKAIAFVARLGKPNITLHFIADAGHGPPYEQPKATAVVIRAYLDTPR